MKTITLTSVSIILLACVLLGSCSVGFLENGDYFFLKSDGAVLPVWVNGNIDSGVFIITVHGGPGETSGHEFPMSRGFQYLEDDYAFVYWDQRMSGLAQGDPDSDLLTQEQHQIDLDRVVTLIEHLYNPTSLYLLGHSWGGIMTGEYLGTGINQTRFNGWIDVDGSIEESLETEEMRRWILERVQPYIDAGEDLEFWQYIVDWYDAHPVVIQSDWQPYHYSNVLGGYATEENWEIIQQENPTPYGELFFASPFTLAFYSGQYWDSRFADGFDVTSEVANITIPSLFIWGEGDGIVTKEVGQFAYDTVGTAPADKRLTVINDASHSPYYDQPDIFATEVRSFVEGTR